MATNIILADDHTLFREGLVSILNDELGFIVVAQAENGREVVKLARKLSADVIVMDIAMPELNGIEATSQVLHENPDMKVIALSMHSDRHFVTGMLKAGAKGYLLKDCAGSELIKAVYEVLQDRYYISEEISTNVLNDYVGKLVDEGDEVSELTSREREVLQLIAEGKATQEIAETLFISVKTVEAHRVKIKTKLKLNSIPELTKYAIREGLTSLE
ncbi:MAG: response regulator transcription factor [Candidatus Marinimicrobia bacterium]|jgi:DNA-binding NarL/FixJ family response regulator|nr:response regulator transcription factor [Candidatus Neomarinimicrobiota bacterium]MBT3574595.1 response regulator transcription factor [Candidatus Neomarinimicrobiota bacterium]MBT3679519.1 response regulator transcription factor [Candidatus Neomarinimicrobiota bacterium]MBT3950675.1 response regulator transcription factor [Candidatus Neomarinimicrobiota bacterium]MBT4252243.1 response regulator transcription factor [Candidatus Neomarinimicrobiota bacterium]